jgi:transcriptional regulator GlxA family with amidase domain
MSSFTARHRRPPGLPVRRVVILIYPQVTLLDATGPAEVFTTANNDAPETSPGYKVTFASRHGGPVPSDGGVVLHTVGLEEAASEAIDTLLISGGFGVFEAAKDPVLLGWLRTEVAKARRFGSTCIGTFLPAAAGLLGKRRVATHWRWCAQLQHDFPELEVEPDPIFVTDRGFWSSAGVSAGIDMTLAMVEADHGHHVALEVARNMVVYLKRPGGQSQFSAALMAQAKDRSGSLGELHAWIEANLSADLKVERLAARAGMSPRNFARVYRERFGTTPAKAVESLRVEAARRHLESDRFAVARIAELCGFGDDERMRRAFLRQLGVAPVDYRRRFGLSRGAAA